VLTKAVRITPDVAVAGLKAAAWTERIPEENYEKAVEAVQAICGTGWHDHTAETLAAVVLAAIDTALGTPRTIIHCFIGCVGTDWDLDSAVTLVREAEKTGWVPNLFGHELAALKDGKLYSFDVRAPEGDGTDAV
jgi:hypothetical protein